jgi:hypothetical protein
LCAVAAERRPRAPRAPLRRRAAAAALCDVAAARACATNWPRLRAACWAAAAQPRGRRGSSRATAALRRRAAAAYRGGVDQEASSHHLPRGQLGLQRGVGGWASHVDAAAARSAARGARTLPGCIAVKRNVKFAIAALAQCSGARVPTHAQLAAAAASGAGTGVSGAAAGSAAAGAAAGSAAAGAAAGSAAVGAAAGTAAGAARAGAAALARATHALACAASAARPSHSVPAVSQAAHASCGGATRAIGRVSARRSSAGAQQRMPRPPPAAGTARAHLHAARRL